MHGKGESEISLFVGELEASPNSSSKDVLHMSSRGRKSIPSPENDEDGFHCMTFDILL
jgi:hypothetical protein